MRTNIGKLMAIALILSATSINAQSKLEVEITNLRSSKGSVLLELFDENNNSLLGSEGSIDKNKCIIVIDELKNGKYAFRYFHDENSNGVIDLDPSGIPLEGFGFSNDAYNEYGPKDFQEWLFEILENTKVEVTTGYVM